MPGTTVGGYDTGNNIKLYYIREYARDNPDEGMTHFLLNSTQLGGSAAPWGCLAWLPAPDSASARWPAYFMSCEVFFVPLLVVPPVYYLILFANLLDYLHRNSESASAKMAAGGW